MAAATLARRENLSSDEYERLLNYKDAELRSTKDEMRHLEEVIGQQSQMLDNLKRQVIESGRFRESDLLAANNKISEQEARMLRFEITQLRQEVDVAGEMLRHERALTRTQGQDIEKRKQQCLELTEIVEQLRAELQAKEREEEMKDWAQKENAVRAHFAFERLEDSKRIAARDAKIAAGHEREKKLNDDLKETRSALECALTQSEKLEKDSDEYKKTIASLNAEIAALRLQLELASPVRAEAPPKPKRSAITEDALVSQVKALAEEIGKNADGSSKDSEMAMLQRTVGSLTTANGFLEKQIDELRAKEYALIQEVEVFKSEVSTQKAEIEKLQKQLIEVENAGQLTNKYLSNELSKVKQQKAQIRCDNMELKRKLARYEQSFGKLHDTSGTVDLETTFSDDSMLSPSKGARAVDVKTPGHDTAVQCDQVELPIDISPVVKEKPEVAVSSPVCADCPTLRTEITKLQRQLTENTEKSRAVKEQSDAELCDLREQIAVQTAVNKKLQDELLANTEKVAELVKATRILDEQCERIMKLKKEADAQCAKAAEKLVLVSGQLKDEKLECERLKQLNVDATLLKQEKKRLIEKVHYLQEELRETHTDYKEEIATLARTLNENKEREAATESERAAAKLEQAQSEKRQMESSMRSLERQLQQIRNEGNQATTELAELHNAKMALTEENLKLRSALAESISKIERHKEEAVGLREENELLQEELKKTKEERADVFSKNELMHETLAEKERLVAYLQSQVPMSKAGKLRKTASRSTLISSDVSVLDASVVDYDDRENIPVEHPKDSSEKPKKRTVAQSASQPLIKKSTGYVNDISESDPLYAVPAVPERRAPVNATSSAGRATTGVGAMKHDIPHRWKSHFVLKQEKCVVCLEGLPRIRLAFKCSACGMCVHQRCARNMSNTCGLPNQLADYYMDTQPVVTNYMSGWVKFWKANDRSGNKWRHAWASMDERRLSFFDNEGLAAGVQGNAAFFSIDLDKDQWRIHMQAVPDIGVKGGVSKESYALLIELRLASGSLFLLAPTPQAKQRWVQSLQSATNRRLFVHRRPSALPNGNSMILGLDTPLNLSVNCAQVLDDWLLIGCQEGLFVTQLSCPRVPCVVAGLTAVFHMELLAELDTLVTISGSQRQLLAVHVSVIREAFKSEQPAVRATSIANLNACHLLTVHTDSERKSRFLCVADPDQVHVLRYSHRMGIFTLFKTLPTNEPAMCLLSIGDGFVFGADQFYYVHSNDFVPRPLGVPGCAPDWPLAAVAVSNTELLLAYHNYGVFCDTKGNRTRPENVDWNRAPLEFVYTAPYLYVVHYETLEVLRLAEYSGPTSRTLLEERDVFRVQNAHFLGLGRNAREVLFALSGKDRTEIHSFIGPTEKKTSTSSLKRKTSTSSIFNQSTEREKRSKC